MFSPNALREARAPGYPLPHVCAQSPGAASIVGVRQSPDCTLRLRHGTQAVCNDKRLFPAGQDAPCEEGVFAVKTRSTIAACLSTGPSPARASVRILRTMAWKTLTHALDQLIFEGLPVVQDLKGAVDELKALLVEGTMGVVVREPTTLPDELRQITQRLFIDK